MTASSPLLRSGWLPSMISCLLIMCWWYSVMAASVKTSVPLETVIEPQTSALIVCAVDGSVYTLDAATGMAKGYFGTGRALVGASSRSVVPGLDGHIYALKGQGEEDEPGSVQVLPMTVQEVVQHPIQTCQNNNEDCGIVTGTKLTYLYALDPVTGRLEWTQQYGKANDDDDSDRSKSTVVVLQRQDYIVRHISAATGEELWNVTLGHVSALDFGGVGVAEDEYLPGRVKQRVDKKDMPSISFSSDGMAITALHKNGKVLWRRRLNTVIASVYGAVGKEWVPLTVVDDEQRLSNDNHETSLVPLLPSSTAVPSKDRDIYLELLWREIQSMATSNTVGKSDMIIYQPPKVQHTPEIKRISHKVKAAPGALPQPKVCANGAYSINGVCRNTLLLLESGQDHDSSPRGLLISWNMVGALVVLFILAVVGLRFLYVYKKRQWMEQQQARKISSASVHSVPPIPQHSPLRARELIRSASLPVFRGFNNNTSLVDTKSNLGNQVPKSPFAPVNLVRTSTVPTAIESSTSSTGNIDGIPLVRYSRYKEEFREIAPLGRGGFGTVFRCENALDGREYAIKKVWIPSSGPDFSERLQRVLREVKILALLDHVNIVRYYTAWLELEDDDKKDTNDVSVEDSKAMTRCFSSELLTGMTSSDGRRPSTSRYGQRAYGKASNPLGWNNFEADDLNCDFDNSLASEDLGFHFERSSSSLDEEGPAQTFRQRVLTPIRDETEERSEFGSSSSSEGESLSSFSEHDEVRVSAKETPPASNRKSSAVDKSINGRTSTTQLSPKKKHVRHILYIQMQLCSQKTLSDFLSSPKARKGTAKTEDTVDIPLALSLFNQIAQGVKYVHEMGLIHRDLKPLNCFMDDTGVCKVGDFGLSRESGEMDAQDHGQLLGGGDESNTAGVGTRSYASPEQMKGSDYGASTDVYSLGIILFELCYPMYTGMERNIVFSQLRKRDFPEAWKKGVAASFPSVHELLMKMLSPRPSDRPSAETVANHMESLLGEFTVLSLDRKRHQDGSTLLRVEANAHEGILPQTIQHIKDAAPNVEIVQYGLRGQDSKAIMEFALSFEEDDSLGHILEELRSTSDIQVVRHISNIRHCEF